VQLVDVRFLFRSPPPPPNSLSHFHLHVEANLTFICVDDEQILNSRFINATPFRQVCELLEASRGAIDVDATRAGGSQRTALYVTTLNLFCSLHNPYQQFMSLLWSFGITTLLFACSHCMTHLTVHMFAMGPAKHKNMISHHQATNNPLLFKYC
jgi:hypothetical protein